MKLRNLLALLRPKQVYKAGIVWLPAIFSGKAMVIQQAGTLSLVTLVWILTSSIVYVFNDLKDAPEDRKRPDRCHRPLAKGTVQPVEAIGLVGVLLIPLIGILSILPGRVSLLIGAYCFLNFLYSLALKGKLGLQQAIIAIGFWLRLLSGAAPIVAIIPSPWAALFTLGLAYFLNCLKGLYAYDASHQRNYRFAMGIGAGLAGSLALAALVAICLKRGIEGSMHFPELPPLFCIVGMHRVTYRSMDNSHKKEQSDVFFRDWVTLFTMVSFVIFFLL